MKYQIAMLLFFLLMGCANNSIDDVGKWQELQDDYPAPNEISAHDLIGTNAIFDGMVYWERSPFINEPPYSFHWVDETVYFWIPNGEKLDKYELKISDCVGLKESLNLLKKSLNASASKMINDGPKEFRNSITVSPVYYRLKYFPPNMLGSFTFNNIERDGVSWIKKAKIVRDIGGACAKS